MTHNMRLFFVKILDDLAMCFQKFDENGHFPNAIHATL